ncbi:hypothetical protein TanjilG_18329 [Lupinus angustifolius]|uniref:Uncharacterized protein n=1 Tax=Lupinus angustifolius TaxID=3871 RepID=A0A1J7HYQ5_LUPAN|nr:hypothetical protein TanjilG_18329 [Lupinus angustifolius]
MSTSTKRELGSNEEESELRRGPWTLEEDSLLIHYIACHGEGRWNMLAKSAGLKRTGKSCRLRWSKIAQHLPGRTDNEIKNYWRTRVQKQARQLNIESGSKRFIDAVKCFWMPRLLQKMEHDSSLSSYSSMTHMNFSNSAEASTSSMSTTSNIPYLPSPTPTQKGFIDAANANHLSIMSGPITPSSDLDSFKLSNLLEISEKLTCSPNVFENNVYNNPIQNNWYVNTNNYGMQGLNMEPLQVMESYDIPQFDFQTTGSDLMLDNIGDTLWNMDAI